MNHLRLVGADWQKGEVERTAHFSDPFEFRVIAAVAAEEHPPLARGQCPAAPERAIAVERRSGTAVLRWRAEQLESVHLRPVPPIQLLYVLRPAVAEPAREPERSQPAGVGVRRRQRANRRLIEVVVVVVRLQDDIDGWQRVERDGGWYDASGAEEANEGCSVAPDRIGENVEAPELHEPGRVANPGERVDLGRRARMGEGWLGEREGTLIPAPQRREPALEDQPSEKRAGSLRGSVRPRIPEAAFGAMVRRCRHGEQNDGASAGGTE